MPKRKLVCPHCGHNYIFRSHRRTLEKPFLRIFRLLPYRCEACDARFYRRAEASDERSSDRATANTSA